MKTIYVVVSTSFLKLRIEKLIPKSSSLKIEYLNDSKLQPSHLEKSFQDASMVVIDLDHHDIDSIETIRILRRIAGNEQLPIIAFGDHADIGILRKAASVGCTEFILKPFADETFIEKISKHIDEIIHSGETGEHKITENHTRAHEEAALHWNNNFIIGIEFIDNEHKQIFDSYVQLYEIMKEGHGHEYYRELLQFIKNYITLHFNHEETFQQEIGYIKFAEHHELHEQFKAKVEELYEIHKDKDISNQDLIQINLFIKDWLIHHILIEDRKLMQFYREYEKLIKR